MSKSAVSKCNVPSKHVSKATMFLNSKLDLNNGLQEVVLILQFEVIFIHMIRKE